MEILANHNYIYLLTYLNNLPYIPLEKPILVASLGVKYMEFEPNKSIEEYIRRGGITKRRDYSRTHSTNTKSTLYTTQTIWAETSRNNNNSY